MLIDLSKAVEVVPEIPTSKDHCNVLKDRYVISFTDKIHFHNGTPPCFAIYELEIIVMLCKLILTVIIIVNSELQRALKII